MLRLLHNNRALYRCMANQEASSYQDKPHHRVNFQGQHPLLPRGNPSLIRCHHLKVSRSSHNKHSSVTQDSSYLKPPNHSSPIHHKPNVYQKLLRLNTPSRHHRLNLNHSTSLLRVMVFLRWMPLGGPLRCFRLAQGNNN